MPKHLTPARLDASTSHETSAPPCRLTCHGLRRAAQRNLSHDELDYILSHGRRFQRTGAIFYFLGARDLPAIDRRDARAARLVGTVLIVEGGALITAYRNPHALRCIKRKMKYRLSAAERAVCGGVSYDNDAADARDEYRGEDRGEWGALPA